ncbi:hypothetical protein scyTo_0007755, partial [Scyliorhinus torazame]|nr:hypothetical protein [Scyliorhinus torazame]
RVEQEELITENGFVSSNSPAQLRVKSKKRHRQQSTDRHESQSENGQKKKRKDAGLSRKKTHDSTAETVSGASMESLKKRKKTEGDAKYNIQKKHKKKKDKSSKDQTNGDRSHKRARSGSFGKPLSEPILSKQGEEKNDSDNCTSHRKLTVQEMVSECSSSNTSEDEHPSSENPQLATVGTITKTEGTDSSAKKSSNSRTGKRHVQTKLTTKIAGERAASSSGPLSSDSETPVVKKAFALEPEALPSVERIPGCSENAAKDLSEASSDSEDSESGKSGSKLTGADTVTPGKAGNEGRQATANVQPGQVGNGKFGHGNGRGRGRGFGGFPWGVRQQCGVLRGRGRGAGIFYYNYENSQEPKPGESKETVTNKHVVVENPPEVPKKDYSKFPLLAAPPQVGERIAFKMLELSENYTPELSDYKEGRLLSYNASTQQVELCVDSISTENSKEPGKFDLIYQTESGEDVVEYAVTREPQVSESWSSLVEPRLIVTPAAESVAVNLV